ncbi:hypothetical protein NOCA2220045 [metagenome]|uniref:Uncharacterized protein n=1 Tax=metagenome TaxID=256318 RepID=A0A2P2BYQ3_9ZZZZ
MAGAPCRGWGEDSGRAAYLCPDPRAQSSLPSSLLRMTAELNGARTICAIGVTRHNSPQGIPVTS